MATEDDAKITRRDFLKFASLAFGGLAFAPLLRTKESVSNSNFEPYTSMLGTNGLTMVLDKNTKTLSLFEGQPDKMEINGIQLIQVTGQPKALVENFPLILSPEQPTKRAGVRKFSYQIEDVLIYSSLLANGTLGTKKYEEEKAKKQILIDANPNKFTSLDTNGNIVSGLYGKVTIEIGRNWDDSPRYGSVKVVSNDNTISRFFRMYPASPQITQPDEKFAESTGKGTYLIRAIPTARTTPEAPEPSVPDLGDPRYGQAIKALGPDRVQITEDQVLVDWEGTGNFVPAFWKDKNGNWKKRFLLRADGAENITAQGLRYSKLDNKQNSTQGVVLKSSSP
ncbi:MAG: hypothetical protein UU16_C0033G0024 [Candidatus Woesebacteria bacterium GW2011_GWA2_40_7]|uniref:Twin-arginine translocation signal domain-containing protein n=1 Tax=Candidatus Woesebacteria bacterium GW2011_GWA2_40_7 TaxID=1618562 RepID=A0A0G0T7P5_9BACT|nr:MAG: hypothetical protein UU16_C0033G0024 [Candidatus Woesebacteria bacterium GW2011_GWA2_40_7]